MKILLRYASNGAVGFTLALKMAELEVMKGKIKFKIAVFSETIRDRAERSKFFTLSG